MSAGATQPTFANGDNSPQLDSLLSKLRPFQRAAFDFAVCGIPLEDETCRAKQKCKNRAVGSNNDNGTKRYHQSNANEADQPNRQPVAGAGTGRILLGDEMGLG